MKNYTQCFENNEKMANKIDQLMEEIREKGNDN